MKNLFVILVMLFAINANAQWEPDVRLTNASGYSGTTAFNAWCVAANGNVVHVVWCDDRDGNSKIFYKRSTDAGVTWGMDIRLTDNSAWYSSNPSIAVSGLNVHVVWDEGRDGNFEIYYKRSTDGGVIWGADIRLTNNTAESRFPSLAVFGSNMHVVWKDFRDSNDEIYYKRSTDGGINWGADTRLTNNTALSQYPCIAVSGSMVHVVWYDNRNGNGNDEIYYKRSINGGINWGADTRLTNSSDHSRFPSIAVSGSNVHVVWDEYTDPNETYYKRSTDGGISWEANTRLTYVGSHPNSIVVSGSNVHIVLESSRNGNYEIYYKRSTDGGSIWEADIRLTNNTFESRFSSIADYGSLVHVVWTDKRDGNYEIYYKRNPTGNLITGIQNISAEIPLELSLSQNYPNPFNPTTKIRFDVVHVGDVRIIVYDIMGREIQTLVNESLKPGMYETTFDGSQLTSSVYFYKMITDGYSETKRMLMIK